MTAALPLAYGAVTSPLLLRDANERGQPRPATCGRQIPGRSGSHGANRRPSVRAKSFACSAERARVAAFRTTLWKAWLAEPLQPCASGRGIGGIRQTNARSKVARPGPALRTCQSGRGGDRVLQVTLLHSGIDFALQRKRRPDRGMVVGQLENIANTVFLLTRDCSAPLLDAPLPQFRKQVEVARHGQRLILDNSVLHAWSPACLSNDCVRTALRMPLRLHARGRALESLPPLWPLSGCSPLSANRRSACLHTRPFSSTRRTGGSRLPPLARGSRSGGCEGRPA